MTDLPSGGSFPAAAPALSILSDVNCRLGRLAGDPVECVRQLSEPIGVVNELAQVNPCHGSRDSGGVLSGRSLNLAPQVAGHGGDRQAQSL